MPVLPTILLFSLPLGQGLGELVAMLRLGTFARHHRAEWTFFAVNIPYWLLVIGSVLEHWITPTTPSTLSMGAGSLLALFGIAIRLRCHFELGGAFSPFIEVPDKQRLVTSGLYSTIRHPMYLGSLLLLVGLPTIVAVKAAWVFALLAAVGLVFRIFREEHVLHSRLADYTDYAKSTWRLAPLVW